MITTLFVLACISVVLWILGIVLAVLTKEEDLLLMGLGISVPVVIGHIICSIIHFFQNL